MSTDRDVELAEDYRCELRSWLGRNFTSDVAAATTEVNENIIGERVLRLPREPRPVRQRMAPDSFSSAIRSQS